MNLEHIVQKVETQPFFKLSKDFLDNYSGKQPKWKDNLGYVVYKRTYARPINGKTEEYWQTVKRVVEGTFTIQQRHCNQNKIPWNPWQAQKTAQRMYELMWDFKFTPPGRGLWMMGTDYMYERGGAPLNNCAFVSTENIDVDFAEPFHFLMDMSMLGVGVGGDTKGAGKIKLQKPNVNGTYVVDDTREGWTELLRTLLNSYTGKTDLPNKVDYSNVRPFGDPINGFGGTASGPGPLKELYDDTNSLLESRVGEAVTSTDIVDIFNMVGRAVVSGNVRRTAEILFGDPNDIEFMELKNPKTNKEKLMKYRWASNNSIFAEIGMSYDDVAKRTAKNGEPGYMWLSNAKAFSRMNGKKDNKDERAMGGNPCLEQTLEPYELCCLSETYPSNHETLDDWVETLKYAYLYAKTVTLIPTHNELTNSVMLRNRRIGCSLSGITQSFKKFGRREFFNKISDGYDKIQEWDKIYSDWLCIPRSIKTTSVKPSGTVSILAGVTPGIHYPISDYYVRNVRFQTDSRLLGPLKEAGYKPQKDKYSANTAVVGFPIKSTDFDRSVNDVTMWEQLENAAQIQQYWADNQVSVTISFDEHEKSNIKNALELYETRLKGVSFLPKVNHGYEQAPYIPITEKKYNSMLKDITPIKLSGSYTHEVVDKFCDGDTCQISIKS